MSEIKTEEIKLPVRYKETPSVFGLTAIVDHNGSVVCEVFDLEKGHLIAEIINQSAALREDAENGGDWFNEFQLVEDYLFQNNLLEGLQIAEKPSELLIAGIKRLNNQLAALRQREGELVEVLIDVWRQFAFERGVTMGTASASRQNGYWAGGLSTLETVEYILKERGLLDENGEPKQAIEGKSDEQ